MEFTGERVVPGKTDPFTLTEHLVRYSFAVRFADKKRVLDAACGCGYGSYLLSMMAESVLGVDIDEKAVEFAGKQHKQSYCPTRFEQCDLEQDFPKGKFDLAVSFETIEHLSEPDFFISNIRKNLETGGALLFSIPRENQSAFHKITYTFEDANNLIGKHFDEVKWLGQDGSFLLPRFDPKQVAFFIGLAVAK